MALLYETGIRMSELIGLKVEDVNGARKELRVYGKGKERVLPLLPSTLESIMQHVMDRPVGGDDLFVTDAEFSVSVICLPEGQSLPWRGEFAAAIQPSRTSAYVCITC